jgi:hypothetical protein
MGFIMNNKSLCLMLGLTLLACSAVAGAVSLSVTNPSSTSQTVSFPNSVMIIDGFPNSNLTFNYGVLTASGAGNVTYTFLGSSAGYTNSFVTYTNTSLTQYTKKFTNTTTSLGSSFTQVVTGGALNFGFVTLNPAYSVSNQVPIQGSATYGLNEGVFGIAQGGSQGFTINGKTYQDLLIYNDPVKGGDYDYNDMVVGVNISPVPEPQTYAMLLAGLGLIGFTARRRKQTLG